MRFDGGARRNGQSGPAGAGAIVTDGHGRVVAKAWQYLPGRTNNEAEYAALLLGLQLAARVGAEPLHVYGDSKLVLHQVFGTWKIKAANLLRPRDDARAAVSSMRLAGWEWIPRLKNAQADALANQAMDTRSSGEWIAE